MKDELGGKIMTNFVGLRVKPYSYLIDDRSNGKKAKGSKTCHEKKTQNWKFQKLFRSNSTWEWIKLSRKKIKLTWIVLKKIIKNL